MLDKCDDCGKEIYVEDLTQPISLCSGCLGDTNTSAVNVGFLTYGMTDAEMKETLKAHRYLNQFVIDNNL